MRVSKTVWLLILILIIAGFLRLYKITEAPPGLYPDEAMNGNNALEALRTGPPAGGLRVYYPENNGREGLFINIQALFLKLTAKNEPWVLRLPSAIFGILTVLGLYFLARELLSARVGLLSSFLLATSFWHVNFSRIGFRAIMAPLLLIWSLYFLIAGFKKLARTGLLPTFYSLLAGILFGLGFYTYIAYRVMPFLALAVLIYFWRKSKTAGLHPEPERSTVQGSPEPSAGGGLVLGQKQFLISIFLFLFSIFLISSPLGLYYLQNPADFFGRTTQVSVFSSETPLLDLGKNALKTLGMFNFAGDWNWRHNLAGRPQLFWPVGILFLIGFIGGLKKLREFEFKALFGWFFLAMLPVVISNEGLPHALRAILMLPPVIIFAALGGLRLYEFLLTKIRKSILLPTCYLLLALLAIEAYSTYFLAWAKNPNTYGAFSADYVQIGRVINQLPRETPKYVVVRASGVDVRGIPMPAQTVMFITDTFTPDNQQVKNIHYILPDQESNIPQGSQVLYLK